MGENIPASAAFVVDSSQRLSPIIDHVFRNSRTTVYYYTDLFHFVVNLGKRCPKVSSILVIGMLSELAFEDFAAVAIVKVQCPQNQIICLDNLCHNGDRHIGDSAAKLGIQMAQNPAQLQTLAKEYVTNAALKLPPLKADNYKAGVFERHMTNIADKYFISPSAPRQENAKGYNA
ncbi:MAG: hypothetical protein A2Y07_01075 [Planctomycetes bacterium GWF2_50_10]|nr:MAG: hypothetical protein A2Y07_01075 [Planctomycetes bacterium GWF2_50_10]